MNKERIQELKQEINAVFALIQNIDAPMKETNIVIMNSCLGSLKFMSNALDELLKEEDDGNADTE